MFLISHTPFSRCTKPYDTQFRLSISLRLIRAIQLIFVALVSLFLSTANAASLGEAELRSWLGEPLNIRIPVITTATEAELLDKTCLRITADSEPFSLVRELRIEIPAAGERTEERHFMLRGFQSVNEPYIKLVVRFACMGQGAISREYTLLLDPRPSVNAPATERNDAIATSNKNIEPVPIQQRLSGQWVTPPSSDNNRADSLANIAEGVYPKSVKRKARYIAALRALNPALAGLDDNAKLPPNTALTLPDLRTLSTTRKVVAAKPASAPGASTPPAIRPSANTKPATSSRSTSAPRQPPKLAIQPTDSLQPRIEKPARAAASSTVPATFSLKLSGGDVDTSRSANVTDEQRAVLREKQFLLDADDQIAQFLSLKNAVKQLENRLNQVQSRLDVNPTNAAPVATADATLRAAPPTTVPDQPKVLAQPTQTAPTQQPTSRSRIWIGSMLAALLLLLVAALIFWLYRRKVKQAVDDENEIARLSVAENTKINPHAQSSNGESAEDTAEINAQNEADDVALAIRRSKGAIEVSPPAQQNAPLNLANDAANAPNAPNASVNFDSLATTQLDARSKSSASDNLISFSTDNAPNSTVDFLIGDDDIIDMSSGEKNENIALASSNIKVETDKARIQRLEYMKERYPELMANTVSIDDADSVINTARHYLTDSDAGAAKAIELLSYALEERPQEIHYWLALFETCRQKSMVNEYINFANKFSILFAQSVEWRHIRQIGHKLAPDNALFRPPSDAPQLPIFDSSVWLTGDPEKTKLADSLAIALRTQLLEQSSTRQTQKKPGSH